MSLPNRPGVFTTAGCDHGRPLLWSRHRARLADSLTCLEPGLGWELPAEDELARMLGSRGLHGPARLRVVAVPSAEGWQVATTVAAETGALGPERSTRLAVVCWPGVPAGIGHKVLARAAWDEARHCAGTRGADDALLVTVTDRVLETSVANVYAVVGSSLWTPPAPECCLPGVMRGWLLDNAGALGLEVREADLPLTELLAADEVWVSNAVVGVRAVAGIDSRSWSAWSVYERLVQLGVPAPGWGSPEPVG